MGNDVSPIRVTLGRINKRGNNAAFLEKKEADGKTYKMTVKFFDRNDDGVLNDSDGVQFGIDTDSAEDRKHFTTNDIASAQADIFANCTTGGDESENTKDTDVINKTRAGGRLVELNLGSTPIKLGIARAALEELKNNISNNRNGAQGSGASNQGGSVPQYTGAQFGAMTIPDISSITNKIYNTGYCGMMLAGGDMDTTAYTTCAPMNAALGAIGAGYAGLFNNLCNALGGNSGGGSVGSTGGGSDSSGTTAPSADEIAKKAEEIKKAKEAEKAERDKKLEEAKKKKEEEITPILNDLNTAIRNPGGIGTDNEKLLATVKKINKDNVLEVLDSWGKSRYASELNEKSLVKLIGDVTDGWSNIENFTHPLTAPSFKYLNPIKEALKERSKTPEAIQIANDADINYNSSLKWNDSKAIDTIDDLYKQVKKEESKDTKDTRMSPLEMKVDADIKAEKDKKTTDAKAKNEAEKVKDEATKAKTLKDKKAEALTLNILPTSEDTAETLQKKIDAAKQKAAKNKNKKLTKAEKAALKKAKDDADAQALAEAEANLATERAEKAKEAEKAKKAAEDSTKAKPAEKQPATSPPAEKSWLRKILGSNEIFETENEVV